MIHIKTQHFSLNRILLLAIGLWPYQKSKFVRLQVIVIYGILISFVIFQFTALITTKCTLDFIIKIISTAIFFSFYIIKYNMFWINIHRVKNMLEQLQDICDKLKDENEIAIILKYGNNAKHCTAIFTSLAICSTFIAILMPIWPQICDTVSHINGSRQNHTIYIVTEYFIDKKEYFYLIILHINAVMCIGATTIIATGTTLLGYIIHVCGMFKIARELIYGRQINHSYRIEQAMAPKVLENINVTNRTMIYKKIFYAVEIHRKAMKFANALISNFEGSFLLLIILSVISLSLNIFAVFRNALLRNKEGFFLHLIAMNIIFSFLLIGNYAGQEVINHSNHIYFTAYNVQWYVAPLRAQKMILFILQRGNKTYSLNIAGLYVPSLECFAMLTKASISYFTVLQSMQH